MGGIAGHSLALFGAVWALLCLLAGAVTTDALLRAGNETPDGDAGPRGMRQRGMRLVQTVAFAMNR